LDPAVKPRDDAIFSLVIPAKAGIQPNGILWIPLRFAAQIQGMTEKGNGGA